MIGISYMKDSDINMKFLVTYQQSASFTCQLFIDEELKNTFVVTDAAGNTGTASITVTLDTQAPVVAISSPVDGFGGTII